MRDASAGSRLGTRAVVCVVAVGLIALAASVPTSVAKRPVFRLVGVAKLESDSAAHGRAELRLFPRHGEVDLNVRRFPRPNGEIFMVWLTRASGRAYIGGAFPRDVLGRFDLSTVVPGSSRVSKRHTTRAQGVVITHLPRDRARKLVRAARADGWRYAEAIKGKRVVHGNVVE